MKTSHRIQLGVSLFLALLAPVPHASAQVVRSAVSRSSGSSSGNAATATALAADPTDCSAGQVATGIAASGNLTCTATPTLTTVTAALTGNASTATALAANGVNCSAGSYPLGVDASGAVEGCTVAGGSHTILSATHTDTTAAALVRGDGLFAIGATPTLQRLAHPSTSGGYFKWNGTDIVASTGAASGTGACTNQFASTLNADAAPTCTSVTDATLSLTAPAIGAATGSSLVLSGNLTTSGGTETIGASGTQGIVDFLATGTAGSIIRSNTAATGGVDNGIILRTVGDLGASDNALLIQDNNGTTLVSVNGSGTVTAAGSFATGSAFYAVSGSNYQSSVDGKHKLCKQNNASCVNLQGTGAPTIASGFGTSPSIAGIDSGGRVTIGTGGVATTGVVNFNATWTTAPACTANDEVTTLAVRATATTTTLTITSLTAWSAADTITYVCIGY